MSDLHEAVQSVAQGGEAVTRLAHNQEIAGSSPAPATTDGFASSVTVPADEHTEKIDCPTCNGKGKHTVAQFKDVRCPPCSGSGKREVARVGLDIVMVPNVRLRACKCGQVVESPNEALLMAARQGKALPPVECLHCGRVLIAQRNLVLV